MWIEPPIRLRRSRQRVVEALVHKMVVGPARTKDGTPHASQMVLLLGMQAAGESRTVAFTYRGARPVQTGRMTWTRLGPAARNRYALMPRQIVSLPSEGLVDMTSPAPSAESSGGEN